MCRRDEAFTLVELVVVSAIIALVGTMAVLAYTRLVSSYRLRSAATLMVGAFREAQANAVRDGRQWRVLVSSGGYLVQYATDATASSDCGPGGWTAWKQGAFGGTVAADVWSRSCVSFDATGRGSWPSGAIDWHETATSRPYSGASEFPRLLDGQAFDRARRLSPLIPGAGTVAWDQKDVRITLDLGEPRYLPTICLGVATSHAHRVRYPSKVRLKAAAGSVPPPDWSAITALYDQPGPPDPGTADRTCVNIAVNGSYRFLYLLLDRAGGAGDYTALDEIDAASLSFTLRAGAAKREVIVTPTTGRVDTR